MLLVPGLSLLPALSSTRHTAQTANSITNTNTPHCFRDQEALEGFSLVRRSYERVVPGVPAAVTKTAKRKKARRVRSEERRVGKECRSRRWPYQQKKKR